MPLAPAALEPLLRLAVVPGVGPARLATLIAHFGSAERVLRATPREIAALPSFGAELARRVHAAGEPAGLRRAQAALALLERHGAVALTPDDLEYPAGFRLLPDPPYLVYAAGDLALLRAPAVALVGTRAPSEYGRSTAATLADGLATAGYTVVSGMARGIDAAAHDAALAAGGGTIGVVGHGIERIYPAENRALFRAVREQGLLLSEFPPGEEPKAGNFPRRNRLIAALSAAVVVVEMALRSGAQHTVNAALDLGRDVFAVPGPIGSSVSEGTNQLIKEGARVITSLGDLLDALREAAPTAGALSDGPRPAALAGAGGNARHAMPRPEPSAAHKAAPADLPPEEAAVFALLGDDERHVDDLATAAGLPASTTLGALLGLELRGLVASLPGKRFRRA